MFIFDFISFIIFFFKGFFLFFSSCGLRLGLRDYFLLPLDPLSGGLPLSYLSSVRALNTGCTLTLTGLRLDL